VGPRRAAATEGRWEDGSRVGDRGGEDNHGVCFSRVLFPFVWLRKNCSFFCFLLATIDGRSIREIGG
jgi:hypothetical protein